MGGQLVVFISTKGKQARAGFEPGTGRQKRYDYMQWFTKLLMLCNMSASDIHAYLHPASGKSASIRFCLLHWQPDQFVLRHGRMQLIPGSMPHGIAAMFNLPVASVRLNARAVAREREEVAQAIAVVAAVAGGDAVPATAAIAQERVVSMVMQQHELQLQRMETERDAFRLVCIFITRGRCSVNIA